MFSKPSVSVLAMTRTVFDSSPNSQKPQIGTPAGKTGRITWHSAGGPRAKPSVLVSINSGGAR